MTFSELLGLPENYSAHGGSVDHMIMVVHWFMLVSWADGGVLPLSAPRPAAAIGGH